ncbi:hypothetical protein [Pseudomonas sp. GD03944]|uniref:hypothetical protein n=1 Tax=Pseudomonas sp. GD03944 TaxID=2975409 RepID=UPI00244C4EB1|nr:hypothetical protein [Pseudomonas sp. GD03944]MDH1265790.1 hypothetical protein [Pseudomonas sp. GD03944]
MDSVDWLQSFRAEGDAPAPQIQTQKNAAFLEKGKRHFSYEQHYGVCRAFLVAAQLLNAASAR